MLASILRCLFPCSWSILVLIGTAITIGAINNKVYFDILPADYHLFNATQRKEFWNTYPKRTAAKLKTYIASPIVWVVGVILIILFSSFKVVPAQAAAPTGTLPISETPTASPTATLTGTPEPTDPPESTNTIQPTSNPIIQSSSTPWVKYVNQVQIVTVIIEKRSIQEVTRLATVIVTATFTYTPLPTITPPATETSTETPTPSETPTSTETETPIPSETP